MNKIPIKLGRRIRLLRLRQGFSQKSFAVKAGLNLGNYGKIERGQANASLDVLITIAQTLNVSWLELMDFEHVKEREALLQEISERLHGASYEELQLAHRVLFDVLV